VPVQRCILPLPLPLLYNGLINTQVGNLKRLYIPEIVKYECIHIITEENRKLYSSNVGRQCLLVLVVEEVCKQGTGK
jgi:hypothetical protein